MGNDIYNLLYNYFKKNLNEYEIYIKKIIF